MSDPFEKMNLGFKVGAKAILDCFPTLNDPKKPAEIESERNLTSKMKKMNMNILKKTMKNEK